MQQLEKGEITAIEAIDGLLSEEYATRETRRIDVALRTAKLLPVKTLWSWSSPGFVDSHGLETSSPARALLS